LAKPDAAVGLVLLVVAAGAALLIGSQRRRQRARFFGRAAMQGTPGLRLPRVGGLLSGGRHEPEPPRADTPLPWEVPTEEEASGRGPEPEEPAPAPEPEIFMEPELEPWPEPEPEPEAIAEPEPEAEPEPSPEPEPELEVAPEPATELEPQPEPEGPAKAPAEPDRPRRRGLRFRRRTGGERHAPSPQATAEISEPSSNHAVDINTAGVAELVRLRGVGRAAAQRIVAEREARGPYSSVWDLVRVDGFDEPRISRFADRATVNR
jgi:competence ComEA-like helix-hairpin-helix protein